jgi:hypothetical protein
VLHVDHGVVEHRGHLGDARAVLDLELAGVELTDWARAAGWMLAIWASMRVFTRDMTSPSFSVTNVESC